jgi:hypothetical protein
MGFNGKIMGVANSPTSSIASGVWTLPQQLGSIKNNAWPSPAVAATFSLDFLVIAGGGGGGTPGASYGGGGGAGGFRTSAGTSGGNSAAETALSISTITSYTVTVGAGGAIAATGANSVFHTITSSGGGLGASNVSQDGGAGGSGGGGNRTGRPGGARIVGQGSVGGFGSTSGSSSDSGAGGGGGAGGPGDHLAANAFTNEPGPPGVGLQSSITGSAVWYAEGGTGTGFYNRGTYHQNLGGNFFSRVSGLGNTGSGGGGGRQGGAGGAGGSGVVIIRYPSARTVNVGAGLTATTTTVGANKVTTFTAGTGTITFS